MEVLDKLDKKEVVWMKRVCAVVISIDEQLLHGALTNLLTQTRKPDEIRVYTHRFNVPRHWRWFSWWFAKEGVDLVLRVHNFDRFEQGILSHGKLKAQIYRAAIEESGADLIWLIEEDVVHSANALEALMKYIKKYKATVPVAKVAEGCEADTSNIIFKGGGQAKYAPCWGLLVKADELLKITDEISRWWFQVDGVMTYRLRPYVVKECYAIHLKDTFDIVYGISVTKALGFARLTERLLDEGVKL